MRYRLLKLYVKFRRRFRIKLNNTDNSKLTPLQTKAIKIWLNSIKSTEAKLFSSISTKKREIELNNIFILLKNIGGPEYSMTIIDQHDNKKNCFEISIPEDFYNIISLEFDKEMERRMRRLEYYKREMLSTDLEELINS